MTVKIQAELQRENDELRKRIVELEGTEAKGNQGAHEVGTGFEVDMFRSLPIRVAYHDLNGDMLWANRAYEETTGLSQSEIVGRKCYSVWGRAKLCQGCPVLTAIDSGVASEAELTPQNQDDWPESQGYWLSCAAPVRDDNGLIIGAIEATFDIADRKLVEQEFSSAHQQLQAGNQQLRALNQQLRATEQQLRASNQQLEASNHRLRVTEYELRQSEEQYRQLFENMTSGVAVYRAVDDGKDFVFVDFNSAAEKIDGIERDKLLGKRVSEVFPGVENLGLFKVFQQVWRTARPAHLPAALYEDEKLRAWRENWVYKVPSGLVVAVYNDITERKRIEQERDLAFQQLRAVEQQLRAYNQQLVATNSALKLSEEKYRTLVEGALQGVMIVQDRPLRLLFANAAMERILGYGVDELVSMGLSELAGLIHPEDRKRILENFKRCVSGEVESSVAEYRVLRKDGATTWILRHWSAIDYLGEPSGLITSIDVTERKRAEQEEARRTAELEALYAGAQSVLSGGDFETMARSIFDKTREVTGARAGSVELLSESGEENELLFLEFGALEGSVESGLPMPIRGLREVAHESGEVVFENDFMNSSWVRFMPEGHAALDNVLFAPLLAEGRVVGNIGLVNKPGGFDESDRRIAAAMGQLAAVALQKWRAEQEVRSERDRLQVVMQTAPIAILIVNEQERVIQVNRAAEELFGRVALRDESLHSGDVIACIHRHESPGGCGHGEACTSCEVHRVIRDGLAGVTVDGLETKIDVDNNGTSALRQILLSVAPLRIGNRSGVILVINDITQMRALHAKMAQSDRLSTMGMLAAGVAHEINNPLSYVLYNLESLIEDLPKLLEDVRTVQAHFAVWHDTPSVDESNPLTRIVNSVLFDDILKRFEDALDGTHRIRDIARSLGTFSRVERDRLVPVNLIHVIEVAINMGYNEIKYRARLVKDYGSIPLIMASEGRLSQVFLNLIINATHAIEEGDVENNQIRVKTWSEGDDVLTEVRDTGQGIPAENIDKLFEPFFSTKEIGTGSGLGLAISKNIVEGYGGTLTVESEVGVGTAFTVRLPARHEAAESVEVAPKVDPQTSVKGRILIVDDEASIRRVMVRMLKKYTTVEAANGEEARSILENDQAFDLILCDMMMPVISGMDLHQWLADAHPELAKQLIFITGGAFTPRAREYLSKVENLRLEKPFNVANFKKIVGDMIRETKTRSE